MSAVRYFLLVASLSLVSSVSWGQNTLLETEEQHRGDSALSAADVQLAARYGSQPQPIIVPILPAGYILPNSQPTPQSAPAMPPRYLLPGVGTPQAAPSYQPQYRQVPPAPAATTRPNASAPQAKPYQRHGLDYPPQLILGSGALLRYKTELELARRSDPKGYAKVIAQIDLSEQAMRVYVNDKLWYDWQVSTGRSGYATPQGSWTVKRMHREYFSRKYDDAPMPFSLFFTGGYAIHGTNQVSRLGRPASHGCVRLHPKNAARLFAMAEVFGKSNMTVQVKR